MASEKTFENKIKAYLKEKGAWGVKFFANRNTQKGIPDLLYCVNGRFLAVEVKGDGGKPTALQIRNVRLINEANGVAFVAWPDAWETVQTLIDYVCDDQPRASYLHLQRMFYKEHIDFCLKGGEE